MPSTDHFYVKIECKEYKSKRALGNPGIDKRNEKELHFLLQHNLYAINTFWKKANSWQGWTNPGGRTKKEDDFLINRFSTGKEHRIFRGENKTKRETYSSTEQIKTRTSGRLYMYQETEVENLVYDTNQSVDHPSENIVCSIKDALEIITDRKETENIRTSPVKLEK